MTNYTVISKFRNKEQCEYLIGEIRKRGKACYSFIDKPADPNNPNGDAEDQMTVFENVKDFYNDEYFRHIFEEDLRGLKESETVIMLLPAGNSVHVEAGIAYGLGKRLILIGKPEKAESLYLIFKERYDTIEDFLKQLR